MRWHADQAVFNKECANYPGFVTKFRVSNQFSEANDHVGYENYRHVCHKWHYKITKAIVFCLDSKDFMQIRNALIILMRILPHYPVLSKLAQIIERKVDKVREEEKTKRPDLFAIASSYIGQLKQKTPYMFKESDFHQVAERPVKETPPVVSGTSNVKPTLSNDKATPAATTTPTTKPPAATNSFYANDQKAAGKDADTKAGKSTIFTYMYSMYIHATFSVTSSRGGGDSKSIKPESSTPTIVSISKSVSSQSTSEREIKRESVPPPVRESQSSRSNDFKEEQQSSSSSASNNNSNNTSSSNSNNNSSSNGSQSERRSRELDREREREREERHTSLSSTRSSQRDSNRSSNNNKQERTEAEHQQRLRERTQRLEELEAAKRALKREKPTRRDERGQHRHDGLETVDLVTSGGSSSIQEHRHYDEYDGRQRDRDLSSVSNESNGSLQHRHSHEAIEFEKGIQTDLTFI